MKNAPRNTGKSQRTAQAVLDHCGRTYAAEAGIRLRDAPMPLYQLLVLSHLLSARMRASISVDAARSLFEHGMRDPRRMADSTWAQRVRALRAAHYNRYDERTATQLGDEARMVLDLYRGDLRRLRLEGDPRTLLQQFPGIGPVGADIFLREVQAVWPDYVPYFDDRARKAAGELGLPTSSGALGRLAMATAQIRDGKAPARLAAGLVRVSTDRQAAEEIRGAL